MTISSPAGNKIKCPECGSTKLQILNGYNIECKKCETEFEEL